MPLEYRINHERRLVHVTASGVITPETLFGYQKEAWSDPAIEGFDELVDMSAVDSVEAPSPSNVSALAGYSAKMEHRQAHQARHRRRRRSPLWPRADVSGVREMKPGSTKEVAVFRTMPDALAWLGHCSIASELDPQ